MAQQNSVRTIQDCLNDNAYGEIKTSYMRLSLQDVQLIISKLMEDNPASSEEFNDTQANDIITLVRDKVMPVLQYNRIDTAKRHIAQAKSREVHPVARGVRNSPQMPAQQNIKLGWAYRIMADCYNYLGSETDAMDYYARANGCGVNCKQELDMLNLENPTPHLNFIVDKAKTITGSSYGEITQNIAQYAYSIVDDALQQSQKLLSKDCVSNFKTGLSVYLRAEVANLNEESPPMGNIAAGFEKMLKEIIYIPYANFLDDNENEPSLAATRQRLKSKQIARGNTPFSQFNLMMGGYRNLIIESVENGQCQIDPVFYDFITSYYDIDTEMFTQQDFVNLALFTDFFRDSIRNRTQHGVVIQKPTFKHVCEQLIFKDDSWFGRIAQINSYVAQDYSIFEEQQNTSLIHAMVEDNGSSIEKFIDDLQNFISTNGRYPKFRSEDFAEKALYQRLCRIRATKKGRGIQLTDKQIEKLDAIGFVWESENSRFNDIYHRLIQYKNEHQHLDVPYGYITEDGMSLGKYIAKLRKGHKDMHKLTNTQVEMLENLGFVFNPQENNTKWFNHFCEDLLHYKQKHGSFKGVINDKELGPKVIKFVTIYQREMGIKEEYRTITPEMLLELRNMGLKLKQVKEPQNSKKNEEELELSK